MQHTADIDTQAIYLLLSAVVHRQLLPDDATFAYTALTDCLLLEATIESEMWVVPYCHYEVSFDYFVLSYCAKRKKKSAIHVI